MARARKEATSPTKGRRMRPGLTPEARNSQLMSMATDLAEQKLRDGTAPTQIIVHYLRMATEKDKLEREILRKQEELMEAKRQNLQSQKRYEDLVSNALEAMRRYSGNSGSDEDDSDIFGTDTDPFI